MALTNAQKAKKYWLAHPEYREKQKLVNRKTVLKIKFGMSLEDYEALFSKQKGLCAICGGQPTRGRKNLDVDHDHKTGKIRGLLCSSCNNALGYLKDDVLKLKRAIEYLSL